MRRELAPWAGKYVGLRWREHGRGEDGVDCWGLLRLVLGREFDIDVPSYDDLDWRGDDNRATVIRRTRREIADWRPIVKGEEQPGDGIMLRIAGHPTHVAVVAGGGYMLHVEENIDTFLERYDGLHWSKRVLGFWRHGSIDENI